MLMKPSDIYKLLVRRTGDLKKILLDHLFFSLSTGLIVTTNTLLGYSPTPQSTSNMIVTKAPPLIGFATDSNSYVRTWKRTLLAK
jgi:hypothetical protein